MEDYRWSSYWEYVYKEKIINRKYLLEKLDNNIDEALKKFVSFMEEDKQYSENVYEIEYKLEDDEVKNIIKAKFNIEKMTEIRNFNKNYRNKILKQLLIEKVTTVNQLSRVLGIDRSIIRKL